MKKVMVACFALGGAVLAATSAQAACTQQFVNTTCDWLGRNCKNNFKSVCTPDKVVAPAIKPGGLPAGVAVATTPLVVAKPGAGLISQDGGGFKPGASVISNDGGSLRPGGSLISNNNNSLLSTNSGTLRNK